MGSEMCIRDRFWSSFSPYRRRTTAAYPEERVVEERRIERDYP